VSSLNLSEWALKHRSFIVFIMITVTLAGIASFFSLGRAEDPPFTFRTMIVQAGWPGATMDDTLQPVTERLERKLQETKGLDFLRSYTIPGRTKIFVNLKGSTKASEVPDIWYQVRKNVGDILATLPAGVVGPGFNDDFGDTFGLIYGFTADGFTHRELRDDVEDIRSRLLQVPGMIARNAVILIDQIETERAQGRDIWDAVVEATLSRFRPIMLTAVSTVLGLIPIAPTVFWGLMAFAIMGGLFVATLLTLLVLPVFYITLYRAKQPEEAAAAAT
jgi:multidrug efflux pump subunit AcrB